MTELELKTWLEDLTTPQLIALRMQRASDAVYLEVVGKTRADHIAALRTISGVTDPVPA